jgi:ribosome-associated translation inhibitor RaiA
MHIQVNTDDNVQGDDALIRYVEAEVSAGLSRFSDHITRVEVHLGDESANRSGSADIRCMLEARPAGQQPVAVTHHAATVEEACGGAIQKLKHLLETKFDRLADHKGGATIRTGDHH